MYTSPGGSAEVRGDDENELRCKQTLTSAVSIRQILLLDLHVTILFANDSKQSDKDNINWELRASGGSLRAYIILEKISHNMECN